MFNARGAGKSKVSREAANDALDRGERVLLVGKRQTIILERVEGVDFIVNTEYGTVIDGSNLIDKAF